MQQYIQTLEGRILSLEHQQTTLRSDLQTAIRNMPHSSTPGIYQTFNFEKKMLEIHFREYRRDKKMNHPEKLTA